MKKDIRRWSTVKIDEKLLDVAVLNVMDVVSHHDSKDRIEFYREVAWDLLKLAAAMDYETELFDSEA